MKEAKRKKKKVLKERRNLQEKMKLKMVIPGDSGPGTIETKNLFALNQITSSEVYLRRIYLMLFNLFELGLKELFYCYYFIVNFRIWSV